MTDLIVLPSISPDLVLLALGGAAGTAPGNSRINTGGGGGTYGGGGGGNVDNENGNGLATGGAGGGGAVIVRYTTI